MWQDPFYGHLNNDGNYEPPCIFDRPLFNDVTPVVLSSSDTEPIEGSRSNDPGSAAVGYIGGGFDSAQPVFDRSPTPDPVLSSDAVVVEGMLRPDYSSFRSKSELAVRRENEAMARFDDVQQVSLVRQ